MRWSRRLRRSRRDPVSQSAPRPPAQPGQVRLRTSRPNRPADRRTWPATHPPGPGHPPTQQPWTDSPPTPSPPAPWTNPPTPATPDEPQKQADRPADPQPPTTSRSPRNHSPSHPLPNPDSTPPSSRQHLTSPGRTRQHIQRSHLVILGQHINITQSPRRNTGLPTRDLRLRQPQHPSHHPLRLPRRLHQRSHRQPQQLLQPHTHTHTHTHAHAPHPNRKIMHIPHQNLRVSTSKHPKAFTTTTRKTTDPHAARQRNRSRGHSTQTATTTHINPDHHQRVPQPRQPPPRQPPLRKATNNPPPPNTRGRKSEVMNSGLLMQQRNSPTGSFPGGVTRLQTDSEDTRQTGTNTHTPAANQGKIASSP